MAGSRLYSRDTPLVRRLPELTSGDYYKKGRLVYSHRQDNDEIDLYVCLSNHIDADDSDVRFYDSDNRFENKSLWLHWASSRVLDSEMGFASINQKSKRLVLQHDSDMLRLDSDVLWVREAIPNLPDSDSIDSDLAIMRSRLVALKSNEILDFEDNEAADQNIIVWDSENQQYESRLRVLKVNEQVPDNTGNITPSLLKVTSGTSDQRPDSDKEAAIYITDGDSDSAVNGTTFIYVNGAWETIINPDRSKMDSDFIRANGSALTGPLIVVDDSDNSNSIVSKHYVDNFIKNSKQDGFYTGDSEGSIPPLDSENFVINLSKRSFSFFDGINTKTIGDDSIDYLSFIDTTVLVNAITVSTNMLSSAIPGELTVLENGVATAFTLNDATANVNGTNFVLDDGVVQSFTVNIPSYSVGNSYSITLLTHEGYILETTKASAATEWIVTPSSNDYGTY